MKVVTTQNGKGIFLSDAEFVSLGFIAISLLGETGIPFLDEYAKKTSPTLLSEYQLFVLESLLKEIKQNAH